MIKLPSQQFEYTLVFSGDPALNLPADKVKREKALEVAQERGEWAALLHAGEQPTLFHLRPIVGSLRDWMAGEHQRRSLSRPEMLAFTLRVALTKVENFGAFEVKTERAGADGEFVIATRAIIDELYKIEGVGRDIVQELGALVFVRTFGDISPKS